MQKILQEGDKGKTLAIYTKNGVLHKGFLENIIDGIAYLTKKPSSNGRYCHDFTEIRIAIGDISSVGLG